MDCRFPIELLSAYLDAELDAPQRAVVEEHLRSCATCRRELAALQDMESLLKDTIPQEPSTAFTRALERRIVERVRPRSRRRILDLAPIFAPLAAAVVLVVVYARTLDARRSVGLTDRIAYQELPARPEIRVSIPAPAIGSRALPAGERTVEPAAAKKMARAEREEALQVPAPAEDKEKDMAGGAAPRDQVVRAIIDSTGTIIKVAAGSELIPEKDTLLEQELTGQKVAPPVIEGRRQQVYSDLSTGAANEKEKDKEQDKEHEKDGE